MDELRMIVVTERQRGLLSEAAQDRLAQGRATETLVETAGRETSHLPAAALPTAEPRLGRALFGRESRAIGADCCVPYAERAA